MGIRSFLAPVLVGLSAAAVVELKSHHSESMIKMGRAKLTSKCPDEDAQVAYAEESSTRASFVNAFLYGVPPSCAEVPVDKPCVELSKVGPRQPDFTCIFEGADGSYTSEPVPATLDEVRASHGELFELGAMVECLLPPENRAEISADRPVMVKVAFKGTPLSDKSVVISPAPVTPTLAAPAPSPPAWIANPSAWVPITTITPGIKMNNPFTGTGEESSPEVLTKIQDMSRSGNGYDVEVKIVVTDKNNRLLTVRYKNFPLHQVFDYNLGNNGKVDMETRDLAGCFGEDSRCADDSDNWVVKNERVQTHNDGWDWSFAGNYGGTFNYNTHGIIVHGNGGDVSDKMYVGTKTREAGDANFCDKGGTCPKDKWTSLEVFARPCLSARNCPAFQG